MSPSPAEELRAFLHSALRLLVLIALAGLVAAVFPQYAHHLLLIVGASLVVVGLGPLLAYQQLRHWRQVQGVLCRMEECETREQPGRHALRYFYPEIEYEYEIDGKRHRGTRVALERQGIWVREVDHWGSPTPAAERWWLKLQAGDTLQVYVDPDDVRSALIVTKPNRDRRAQHVATLVAGVLFILIWGAFLALGLTPLITTP